MATLDEKLCMLDQEIYTLTKFLADQGNSAKEIHQKAEPLTQWVWTERKQWYRRMAWKAAILVALVASLWCCDPAYRLAACYSRRVFMQVLPMYDWTVWYGEPCLVENIYYNDRTLDVEHCESSCGNLTSIPRLETVTAQQLTQDYLLRNRPVVLTTAAKEWPAYDTFSISFLSMLFDTEPSLKSAASNHFVSNAKEYLGLQRLLLNAAHAGRLNKWFAHWENYEAGAARCMRQFYPRPAFLPAMVELTAPSWLFLSSRFTARNWKRVDFPDTMMMFAQLRGDVKVHLTPRDVCAEMCQEVYVTLHPGEMLIVTEYVWQFEYLPQGSPESISVGVGGTFYTS